MGNSHAFHLSSTRVFSMKERTKIVSELLHSENCRRQPASHFPSKQKCLSGKDHVIQSSVPPDHLAKCVPTYKHEVKSAKWATKRKSQKVSSKGKREASPSADTDPRKKRVKNRLTTRIRVLRRKRMTRSGPKQVRPKKHTKATKNDDHVLHVAFNLFSRGKDTISVEDVEVFFSKYSNEKYSYVELRDMVHRACNGYEIDFDCFKRMIYMDEQVQRSRMMRCKQFPSGPVLPGQVHGDDLHNAESLCEKEDGSIQPNRRDQLELQKQEYGVYNPRCCQSFTTRGTILSVKESHLDDIVLLNGQHRKADALKPKTVAARNLPNLKRSISENRIFSPVEEQYFLLQHAFQAFDTAHYGSVKASDLTGIMKELGVSVNRRQIRELFSLVGKKNSGELNFRDFVELYKKCSCF